MLELLHDSPITGHFGIEKTYQRPCERFYWPCMRMDVRNWIESCYVCPKREGTMQKHSITSVQSLNGNLAIRFGKYFLMSWVHFPSLRETITILLIGYQFSKWYEAVAIPYPINR